MFREKWGGLHPLSRARRMQTLASLQPLAEMQVAPPQLVLILRWFHYCSNLCWFCRWTCCELLSAHAAASVYASSAVPGMLGFSIVFSPVTGMSPSHRPYLGQA